MTGNLPAEGQADSMDQNVDLRVFELLASRLCHDLVSPVGAIKSGLELFTEYGDDADGQTMALVDGSAEQASLKLQCFRLAYGQAGSQRDDVTIAETVNLVTAVCGNQRMRIEATGDAAIAGAGNGKLLMNMAFVGAEAIGRGGVLTLGAGNGALQVVASGAGAQIDDEMRAALDLSLPVDALTPKTVQGYFTALLARRAGQAIRVDAPTGSVSLTVAG